MNQSNQIGRTELVTSIENPTNEREMQDMLDAQEARLKPTDPVIKIESWKTRALAAEAALYGIKHALVGEDHVFGESGENSDEFGCLDEAIEEAVGSYNLDNIPKPAAAIARDNDMGAGPTDRKLYVGWHGRNAERLTFFVVARNDNDARRSANELFADRTLSQGSMRFEPVAIDAKARGMAVRARIRDIDCEGDHESFIRNLLLSAPNPSVASVVHTN